MFNQRGDDVIVRGAPARVPHHDKQLHLTENDAHALLTDALGRYRTEHLPARVVLHKTSSYTPEETAGFRAAADNADIDTVELLWFPAHDPVRLFRPAAHPPLRGALFSLDTRQHVLYTRGSVPFYGTYPGMYIPTPLPFRMIVTESSPEHLAEELLALTKMNWNQTQLDGRQPITLRTADRVGQILRHLSPQGSPTRALRLLHVKSKQGAYLQSRCTSAPRCPRRVSTGRRHAVAAGDKAAPRKVTEAPHHRVGVSGRTPRRPPAVRSLFSCEG